jgi:hypothetical protein
MREDVADGLDIGNEFRMIGMSARRRAAKDQGQRPGQAGQALSGSFPAHLAGRRAAVRQAAFTRAGSASTGCCKGWAPNDGLEKPL